MIKFNKPTNLNGEELLAELNSAGIEVNGYPMVDDNRDLWLDISSADSKKAEQIVSIHNGNVIPKEPTLEDKLASVGLSIAELKAALA